MQNKKISLSVFFLMFLLVKSYPQITSSPYSYFGLGLAEENITGVNEAMGGTGIALLSDQTLNSSNPASYSGLDSLTFLFELGFFGKYTSFRTPTSHQALFDSNFRYLSMGFRINRWLAVATGIAPYSSVGFNINTIESIEGSPGVYTKSFTGDGGLNQVFLANSISISKNLAVGINTGYLFGNITQTELVTENYSLEEISYLHNIHFDFGLNYRFITGKTNFNLGMIYSSGEKLHSTKEAYLYTLNDTTSIPVRNEKYQIPGNLGVGLSLSNDNFRGAIDYEIKKWKGLTITNPLIKTRNSRRASIGLEFSPPIRPGSSLNNRMIYRLGGEYATSYLVIGNEPINYRAVSFGLGIPMNGSLSVINLSFKAGQNGSTKHDLIKESIYTLNIDIALSDIWFFKRKYY